MSIDEMVRLLFERHGVATVVHDRGFLIPAAKIAIETEFIPERQLDVRMTLPDGRVLIESFAGYGTERDEIIRSAFENFGSSSFHVLLRALVKDEPDDQLTVEQWDRHRAYLGPCTARGEMPAEWRNAWFPAFETAIRQSNLRDDLYWIRFYYAQLKNETFAVEVLRNNEPWDELQTIMGNLAWPHVEEFYSVRFFMILKREGVVRAAARRIRAALGRIST